ncbi:hypothetical protein F3Y22_tig00012523pilonHSYRG00032 [Hibiscus syriacus]|uniref:Uncharacterized protein n=1 Tax=Hibiscus syriacus TaxID=106335 RepID=A0A6A3C5D7_HIBSY|nr:hypothetical protein F3Y22_tig00012523pilonHSYRG00032 [Hibiscus syriacus]
MHRRITVFIVQVLRNPPIIPSRENPFHSQFNPFARGANGLASFQFFSFTPAHLRVPDPDDPASLMKEDALSVCSQMWIENFREPDRSALDDLLALGNAVLDNRFKWGSRLEFFIKSPKDKTDYESLSKRKIKATLTTTQPAPFQHKLVQEFVLVLTRSS